MIAARQIAFGKAAGGGLPTARDYIQAGLVAMWDGIENAGWGMHDGSATVWKDLVGNADLELLGDCSWYDSYCKILGLDNGAFAKYDGTIATLTNGWTFRFVFRPLTVTSYVARPYSIRPDFGETLNGFEMYLRNGTVSGFFSGNGSSYVEKESLFDTSLNMVNTNNFTIKSDGTLFAYVNSSQVASATVPIPKSIPEIGLGNSMKMNGNRGLNEDVFGFAIYSRALTAEEIAYNYSIDKARFGL